MESRFYEPHKNELCGCVSYSVMCEKHLVWPYFREGLIKNPLLAFILVFHMISEIYPFLLDSQIVVGSLEYSCKKKNFVYSLKKMFIECYWALTVFYVWFLQISAHQRGGSTLASGDSRVGHRLRQEWKAPSFPNVAPLVCHGFCL